MAGLKKPAKKGKKVYNRKVDLGSGYKKGSRRQGRGETPEHFKGRVILEFPEVILAVNASFFRAASVFALSEEVLAALTATSGLCKLAYTDARVIADTDKCEPKEKKAVLLKHVPEKEAKDKRLIRKYWATDPVERRRMIRDALFISLLENEGNVVEVCQCLNLKLHEALDIMDGDTELEATKERGMKIAVLQAEASLAVQAKAGNVTAIKSILSNKDPENWSERSTVNVKHEGFSPPADGQEQTGTVLSILQGDNEDEGSA